jgi:hypothetical protein
MLAAYRKLRILADAQRLSHDRLIAQVDRVLSDLAEEYCQTELDILEEKQRTLRLITTGTPVTEALTPDDKDPLLRSDPHFNQRQYDAHTQILKITYRKLCQLCHPDKGGDKHVFEEVQVAYKMRDHNRLNAIYLSIVQGRNLYWQQDEGVYHVSTEYERYRVNVELLRQTPGWRATRFFLAGQVNTAVDIVRQHLADKIAALGNEINYVINKGNENGEEGKGSEEQEVGQSIEGRQIEQEGVQVGQGSESQEGREVEEGPEPAGESASGPRRWWQRWFQG